MTFDLNDAYGHMTVDEFMTKCNETFTLRPLRTFDPVWPCLSEPSIYPRGDDAFEGDPLFQLFCLLETYPATGFIEFEQDRLVLPEGSDSEVFTSGRVSLVHAWRYGGVHGDTLLHVWACELQP